MRELGHPVLSVPPLPPDTRGAAPRRAFRWPRWPAVSPTLLVPGLVVAVIVAMAVFAPWLLSRDPNEMMLGDALRSPSLQHWMGTDQLGRDVFSRVVWGSRVSLVVALAAVGLAGVLGAFLGMIAAHAGGWLDALIMRLADLQLSLPSVILALVLVAAAGPSTANLVIVLTLANWAHFCRIIRSEALSIQRREFVLLARLAGAGWGRIVWHHIVPNVRETFIVLATLDIGLIVLFEATLSFLGLGVQPPDASWGNLIADGRTYLDTAWWIAIFPGAVLLVTVLSCNLLGEALRDRLSPSLKLPP